VTKPQLPQLGAVCSGPAQPEEGRPANGPLLRRTCSTLTETRLNIALDSGAIIQFLLEGGGARGLEYSRSRCANADAVADPYLCLFPLSMHAKVRSNYIQASENVGYRVCAMRVRENRERGKITRGVKVAMQSEPNSAFFQINARYIDSTVCRCTFDLTFWFLVFLCSKKATWALGSIAVWHVV
jgi:hypothetical protein